ncbi:MAG: cell surface protein SprA, partial [Paramuribaculum sp.]
KALRNGDLSVFIRLGSDVKNNFYEYEVPLRLTPAGHYADSQNDRFIVWPEDNFMDITLQNLVELKKERNAAKRSEQPGVGFGILYTGQDPDHQNNRMAVMGNPSLSDIRVMMVGVRNNSSTTKDGTVWLNELKVTDFESEGGWAADGSASLAVSDIATINFGAHYESAGFGGVDQSLNERRMDDLSRYSIAVQADLGRFLPEKAKLRAPIFYSMTKEKTTPKYNPLDQDVKLKDALEGASQAERDSINAYAIENSTQQNFSISGLQFDVRSKNPMPWDPANFTFNFSFNKTSKTDPTTEYENINDYRGSFQYTYTPYIKGIKPFSHLKGNSKGIKFLKDWELNWFPNSISFLTSMSRYYYEQQTRSATDVDFRMPVSVSKNFLWDRQLAITWNLTKSLSLTFNSNTSARIEEPVGAVNKKLFPDKYREWRDTVWNSILHLGTPWGYNQTFTGTYRAPFNRIPAIDFISANATYNATYRWDRGATIDNTNLGNSISNQAAWNIDGRLNFESLYNKNAWLKRVNTRFASSTRRGSRNTSKRGSSSSKKPSAPKPKRFERTYTLNPDSSTMIKHNLRNKKVKVSAVNAADDSPMDIS